MDDLTNPHPTPESTTHPTPDPTIWPGPGETPPPWPRIDPYAPVATAPVDRPRGRRTVALVLAGSLAAATIASAGTAAFVLGTRQDAAPGTANQTSSTATPSPISLAGLDGSSVVNVAKAASPAVVTITTVTGSGNGPFGSATGVGSGFIYDAGGWILTNYHVVEGGGTLTVTLNDGRELPGRVASTDEAHDLAVVKIDGSGFPTIPIGSSANLQVGQLVIAIGSPLGEFTDSVTTGILSATGRSVTVADQATRQRRTITNLLQTDAAINEGNSGGPLLDARGQVVGLNSATASGAQGIGFAIPIDAAASIMASAMTH